MEYQKHNSCAFVSIKPLDKINMESDPKILVYTYKRDDEDIAKALVKKLEKIAQRINDH